MNETVISVNNLTKKFRLYTDKSHTLKERVFHPWRNKYDEKLVLDDISFEVKKGEALGLIGTNGCGKSTLLGIIGGILYPNSGSVQIKGKVYSMLELGAGFHQDLTGRENIYINASIYGLSRKKIDERIDDIIDFSELSKFIDSPIRTYSSGMYMRLAFSVAINVNADILLIDEILAVGDMHFQEKCIRKLKEIRDVGTTIVLVSHSTAQIEDICDRSIWIDKGRIRKDGDPKLVNESYSRFILGKNKSATDDKTSGKTLESPVNVKDSDYSVMAVSVTGSDGKAKKVFALDDELNLRLRIFSSEKVIGYGIELNLVDDEGIFCYGA